MRLPPHAVMAITAVVAVVPAAGAARPDPYPVPRPLPALSATTIDARYAAADREIRSALEVAGWARDTGRVRALTALLRPGRRFLSFDGRGDGRAVEVIGDLARAERVAVVVPGADNSLDNYDGSWKFVGGGARALGEEVRRLAPGSRTAVVAWLGYDPPATSSFAVLGTRRADAGARELRRFVAGLRRGGRARIGLLCHSYGSVVCARALPGLPVDDVALYGSPGTTARSAAGLRTPARVWAGRSSGDWMAYIPHIRVFGAGFGADPVSPAFGARIFAAGSGTHADYLRPGTRSLRNLALIALGHVPEPA
ncbi:hypothetical protein DPM19_07905 [Actinomadura craniellae]|uniref:DUF1023 domain-containing protein n=1 Tax=Actinomadura craniellae TaxID=2231787 RepID=A0A365H9M0_9ACTN|nr:alpha/beta hydrolase [Actinomadura craniellae]RAY15698.1 hypothetical protein DPM19_07905 [Actinomadura craniellae]